MALSIFSRRNRIVNIIIHDHCIRYVELKQSKPPIPHKWGERLLPNGIINNGKILDYETLSMILEECVTEWKIRKRQVRFLIPESFVIIRKVNIPADVEDDEIKGYLYLELGTSIHLPFEEPVFDTVVLSKDKEKKEVLIFAAQEDYVLEYMNLFTDVKLRPVEAEVSPLALYRLYHHLGQAKENEDLVSVEFDLNSVNICIFENSIPFFMHHLPIEFDEKSWRMQLNKDGNYELLFIGDETELSYLFDDVYKEISRLLDFYRYSLHQGKKQVSKILLNGDHPFLSKIHDDMNSRFEITLVRIQYNESNYLAQELPPPFYLALGLALKGVQ